MMKVMGKQGTGQPPGAASRKMMHPPKAGAAFSSVGRGAREQSSSSTRLPDTNKERRLTPKDLSPARNNINDGGLNQISGS